MILLLSSTGRNKRKQFFVFFFLFLLIELRWRLESVLHWICCRDLWSKHFGRLCSPKKNRTKKKKNGIKLNDEMFNVCSMTRTNAAAIVSHSNEKKRVLRSMLILFIGFCLFHSIRSLFSLSFIWPFLAHAKKRMNAERWRKINCWPVVAFNSNANCYFFSLPENISIEKRLPSSLSSSPSLRLHEFHADSFGGYERECLTTTDDNDGDDESMNTWLFTCVCETQKFIARI